eukprot:s6439_g2.t2
MLQVQLLDCDTLPAHDRSDCKSVQSLIRRTTLKRAKETTRWMVDNALGHRLGQIHSVETQRDDRDMVCLDSQMEYTRRRQQHMKEKVDAFRRLKAAWQEGAYHDWGQHWSKADKVVSTRFNAPHGRRRNNMHEWGPWRCYSCKFQVKDSNKVTNLDEKTVWGVCTIDGNYDGCDARNLCCNNHAVRSFFNAAIDSVKQPLRGKFQAARHKALTHLVLLGESVACPAGYSQQGYLGADINGCGLEACEARAEVNTIKECKDRCDARNDCLSFNYAPPNAKDHAKVCTLYDKAQPTHTYKDELVFCARTHYKLAVSGAYCQKRWWLGNPAHGIPNLDACAVAAAKNQHCHGKYFQFHDYGGGGRNCQCALDLCPDAGTTGQDPSNNVYRLLKPMGFHGQGYCNEADLYKSKAWELASSSVGEQGFDTDLFASWKEKAWTLCREKNSATKFISVWKDAGYRCYSSSACTPSGHANVQTWQLV